MTGIVDFRTELLDETGAPITASNPLPTTGGGGGGGSALSDTVFVDSTGQLFVYRDTGTGTPNAYEIPAWTLYTPVGAVTSASAGNAAASATGSAVPGSADYVGFNSGGNLVGVSSSNPFPVNIVAGSSGNAAASATGSAVPASADYIGFNVGGNLTGVSATNPLPTTDAAAEETRQSMSLLLVRMLNYLNAPMGYDKSLQRQRGTVTVESGTVTTVTTVTTVGTVTTLSNIDGYNGRMQILDQKRTAWAQCVRARIT
jgi:hypothetical protein